MNVDQAGMLPLCIICPCVLVTEYEIERGLLEAEKPNEEVLCFVRQISNLEKNLHQTRARKFIDSINDGSEVDVEAQGLLQVLRDEKIPTALSDERNSEFFSVSWKDPEHSNPNDDAEYLRSFCSVFQDKMCWLINQCVQQTRSFSCNTQVIEILQHLKMGKKLSQDFRGREGQLRKINLYLRANDGRPMVLFGESGSGKTSVIAKVSTSAIAKASTSVVAKAGTSGIALAGALVIAKVTGYFCAYVHCIMLIFLVTLCNKGLSYFMNILYFYGYVVPRDLHHKGLCMQPVSYNF